MSDWRWKNSVRKRDGWICRRCGFDKNLHVHHILPKAKYPILRYYTNNGLTLCGNCHCILKDKEERINLRGFLPDDPKIDNQLKALLKEIHRKDISIDKRLKASLTGEVSNRVDRLVKIKLLVGKGKFRRKEYEPAIATYSDILSLKPDFTEVYYYRGKAKYELKEYKAAIHDYDNSLRLKPDDVNSYFNRGRAKYALRQYQSAITDYDMVLQLASNNISAHFSRGLAKYKLADHDAAITDFDGATRLNPNFTKAYYYRGLAKYELGRHDAAIADFNEVNRLDPNFKKGSSHLKLATHEQAIRHNADDAFAYYYRGQAKAELGQHDAATIDYDTAIGINPKIYYDVLLREILGTMTIKWTN